VYADIDSASGSLSQTIPFAAGQQIAFLNLVNPMPDPNETFTLTLSVTTTGVLPGPGDQTDRLVLAFIDAGQGPSTCYLCYVEWLGRFLGFDPQFGAMHQVDIAETQALALNNYYAALHDLYAPEISNIVASNPTLLWSSLNTLDEWTPGVESLGNGTGDTITITQQMVDDGIGLLNGIKGQASQGLQVVIQHEQDALNLPSFVGLNMNQAWNQVMVTRNISGTFLTVILK